MAEVNYPDIIKNLPDADLNIDGVSAKLLQAEGKQIVFFEMEPIGTIPPHAHQEQWGVVLEGEIELTVDGVTTTYVKGDSYFIPAGAVHSGRVNTRSKIMDLFNEPARYKPRP